LFGFFPGKNGDVLYNMTGIIGIAQRDTRVIYREFTSPAFDTLKLPLFQDFCGMIKWVSANPSAESPRIYDLYSYRGFREPFARSKENIEIVTRYLIFMSMHAEKLMNMRRYREANELYQRALSIPAEKLAYNIYYNMAASYAGLNEGEKALAVLKLAIEDKPDFMPAYEAAGRIFYGKRDIFNASRMFSHSVKLGSKDPAIKALAAETKAVVQKNEKTFDAGIQLEAEKKYREALAVYDALIKEEYRPVEILLREGRIFYMTGEKEKAMKAFTESNRRVLTAEAYFYRAKIYFEKNMYDEALMTAYEGLTRFKDDKNLQKLYKTMKGY
jgi:tetratricopeptide (TPR) repeat protein